jgi:hypothetical protein
MPRSLLRGIIWNAPDVIQFTVECFGWVHKRLGLTDGFRKCLNHAHIASTRRRLRAAFLIYGMMVVGLLGFFVIFPDMKTLGTQGEGTPLQTAAKAVRYEAVIANWNRYRNKDARADAR